MLISAVRLAILVIRMKFYIDNNNANVGQVLSFLRSDTDTIHNVTLEEIQYPNINRLAFIARNLLSVKLPSLGNIASIQDRAISADPDVSDAQAYYILYRLFGSNKIYFQIQLLISHLNNDLDLINTIETYIVALWSRVRVNVRPRWAQNLNWIRRTVLYCNSVYESLRVQAYTITSVINIHEAALFMCFTMRDIHRITFVNYSAWLRQQIDILRERTPHEVMWDRITDGQRTRIDNFGESRYWYSLDIPVTITGTRHRISADNRQLYRDKFRYMIEEGRVRSRRPGMETERRR